jgi:ATP/maltotriose-dependent transcriptional regulator MalT
MGRVELGMIQLAQGELARARASQEEAIKLSTETRFPQGEGQARYQLGEIALVAGDFAEARAQHDRAMAVRTALKEERTILESQAALANIALEEGRVGDAEKLAAAVERALKNSQSPLLAVARLLNARVRLARNDPDGAERQLAGSRTHAGRTERISLRSEYRLVEAEISIARGQIEQARAQLDTLRQEFLRSGMLIADFERRLLQLRIDRADAAALEKDARARGAVLIANRVKTL